MEKLASQTPIVGTHGLTIGDFWAWGYSEILSNANRGVFAEFLVGAALGIVDMPRIEWDEVDLHYREKTVEVKSAAYSQSWAQNRPSKIVFSIAEAYGWDAATNTYQTEARRAADCYVFCLYTEQDRMKARERLLDVSFWDFFVIATGQLNAKFRGQKSIGLTSLRTLCQPIPYQNLRATVDHVLGVLPDDHEGLRA